MVVITSVTPLGQKRRTAPTPAVARGRVSCARTLTKKDANVLRILGSRVTSRRHRRPMSQSKWTTLTDCQIRLSLHENQCHKLRSTRPTFCFRARNGKAVSCVLHFSQNAFDGPLCFTWTLAKCIPCTASKQARRVRDLHVHRIQRSRTLSRYF